MTTKPFEQTSPAPPPFAAMRFSSADLPPRDRIAIWREVIGRKVLRIDIEPWPERQFHIDATVRTMPGAGVVSASISEFRVARTRELTADGNDNLRLVINLSGSERISQCGRELVLGAGEATLMSCAEPFTVEQETPGRLLAVYFPPAVLAPLLGKAGDRILRPVPRNAAGLRLLTSYVGVLDEEEPLPLAQARLIATHIQDLAALAIGATRDAAALAEDRGVRAARLHAIKADVVENLGISDLSIGAIAHRHQLHIRYVQRLFEADGTTYSEFVLAQRLSHAYRLLANPRHAGRAISDIAEQCGFGDPAYFSRRFRRAYGAPPSELRMASLTDRDQTM
ncbi:MAG TPA: AraC family transcriptional regulator [Stellaceae bacterium]|nr:AraC family transcriptional regulator [Stellaceae bacterium]